MRFIVLVLVLLGGSALQALADGPWQGGWRESYHSDMSLRQEGKRVWGEYDNGEAVIEARVMPDGTTLRGTSKRSDSWSFFELRLFDDGNGPEWEGNWTRATKFDQLATGDRWWGKKTADAPLPFTEATGPGPFWPSGFDPDSGAWATWLAGEGIVPTGAAGNADLSAFSEVAPGDTGLWELRLSGNVIGVVGLSTTPVGLKGQGTGRIAGFAGENEFGVALDVDHEAGNAILSITPPEQAATDIRVRVKEMEGDQYRLTGIDPFLGQNSPIFSLNLRNGTIPGWVALPGASVKFRVQAIGLAAEVRSGPRWTDPLIGHIPVKGARMSVRRCYPALSPDIFELEGNALRTALRPRACEVTGVTPSGWVAGDLLTR